MSEIVVIEQNKKGEVDGLGGFYLKLTTDRSNQSFIVNYKIMGVTVLEAMSSGSPVVSLSVIDTFGDLVNHKIIEGNFQFYLYISNDEGVEERYQLMPSYINSMNATEGRNDNQIYTINMVAYYWPKMFMSRPNRAWRDVRYSEVVETIASEIGFDQISVTPTKEIINRVIQPYWTNFQMLSWLKERCVAQQTLRSGYFDFATTINNGFYFKSIGDIIKSKNAGINLPVSNATKVLTMDQRAPSSLEEGLRRAKKLEVEQNYMSMMVNGAGGITPSHYDYMNKEYVQGESHRFSDTNEPQLSDWAFISEDHEINERRIYTHSAMDDIAIAKNRNSDAVNSIQKVKGLIDGVSDIQMGEVVEVQIPLSSENSKIAYNEYFSGFYVVTEKKIIVNLNTNVAQTQFKFSRQGVNGPEVNSLITSTAGKSL